MARSLVIAIVATLAGMATAYVAPNTALSVIINAHQDECFYEDITIAGRKVFLHFAVTNGGALDIDANVYGPDDQLIWSTEKEMEARVLFKSRVAGPHRFCFSNKMSTISKKTVTFSIEVGDSPEAEAKVELDPFERSLFHITEGLTEIKNEQQYLRQREHRHRSTAESTNTRVLVWSILEILLIAGLAGGQMFYLVNRFEKRRNV
jgi:hypothetical protein